MRRAVGACATVYVIGIGGVAGISLKGESALRQIAARPAGGRSSRRARASCRPCTSSSPRTCSSAT